MAPGAFFRVSREKGSRSHFPQGKLRVIVADDRLAGHLTGQRFQISPRSDRMGYRLEGGKIAVAPTGELISTAVPTGAIQVPPTGQPILLMNDHATTGGYAIGAVVIAADLPLAGQLAPGDSVEFVACSLEAADAALHQREALLDAS
jgi:antagonist of KipI